MTTSTNYIRQTAGHYSSIALTSHAYTAVHASVIKDEQHSAECC